MVGNLIDLDLTIKKFFASVDVYLKRMLDKAKNKQEYEQIMKTIKIVGKIAQAPRMFSNYEARVEANLEPDAEVFMRKDSAGRVVDNSVWQAFSQVLYAIEDYYNVFDTDKQNNLLKAIKNWNYRTSTSLFKSLVFKFKNPTAFAARVSMENMNQR